MKYRGGQKGVTLLELLIVIAIVAIFATMAAPNLTNFVRDNRLTSARMQFVSDLNLAKGEAIKRNSRVLVCSGNAAGCSGSVDWAAGWIVCYDADKDGVCDIPPADGSNPNPLLVRDAINGQGLVFTSAAGSVFFNPIGTQGAPGSAAVGFTISGNWSGYTKTRSVAVASTGNITSR